MVTDLHGTFRLVEAASADDARFAGYARHLILFFSLISRGFDGRPTQETKFSVRFTECGFQAGQTKRAKAAERGASAVQWVVRTRLAEGPFSIEGSKCSSAVWMHNLFHGQGHQRSSATLSPLPHCRSAIQAVHSLCR